MESLPDLKQHVLCLFQPCVSWSLTPDNSWHVILECYEIEFELKAFVRLWSHSSSGQMKHLGNISLRDKLNREIKFSTPLLQFTKMTLSMVPHFLQHATSVPISRKLTRTVWCKKKHLKATDFKKFVRLLYHPQVPAPPLLPPTEETIHYG